MPRRRCSCATIRITIPERRLHATRSGSRDPRERFIAGDPFRGLAALSVFFFHVAVYSDLAAPGTSSSFGPLVHRLLSGMNVGVWMFFVLSGYLLTRPFARSMPGGPAFPNVGAFFRNRLRRLVPGLWALVAATFLVYGIGAGPEWKLPLAAAFGQVYSPGGFGDQMPHAWTLDAEIVFYLRASS
jgi:peptidoglycan/LPS O-acetylase OafA/YrhL